MANEYKLSYSGSEINAKLGKIDSLAEKSEIPTKVSELTNDKGYLTTVPNEYVTKTYVDDAINGIPTPDVSGQINTHNTAQDAHSDIRESVNSLSSQIAGKQDKIPTEQWIIPHTSGTVTKSVYANDTTKVTIKIVQDNDEEWEYDAGYASITHNGTTYIQPATFEATIGDTIELVCGQDSQNGGGIAIRGKYMNGGGVSGKPARMTYTIVSDTTLIVFGYGLHASVAIVRNGVDLTDLISKSDIGRTTAVNQSDTRYQAIMARGTSLNRTEKNPTINGTICWTYE